MSSPLILSAPPVAPPVSETQWQSITVEWVGADGSVWDLSSGDQGVVLQRDGTEGEHDPVITKYSSEARAFHGKRNRGWRALAREVFWPVLIYADDSEDWRDTYHRFFRSIHPEVPGTWRISFAGVARELRLTGRYDNSHAFETHPTVLGWGRFGVQLEAEQPFWEGTPVLRGPWRAPAPLPFYPGPPFHISAAAAFGSAVIDNPGDVNTYITWEAVGPLSSIVVGAGGRLIEVPFPVADGEMLRLDTDLRNPTALLGPVPEVGEAFEGVDMTTELGFQPLAAIPPGESRELHVAAIGDGSISARLTPLHFRAI